MPAPIRFVAVKKTDKIQPHNANHVDIVIEEVKKMEARKNLVQSWLGRGAIRSDLGLPLDPNMPLRQLPEGRVAMDFRGGTLSMPIGAGMDQVAARVDPPVIVTLEGYGLEMRQEKGDEIYGSVGAMVTSTGEWVEHIVPMDIVGPEDDNRVRQLSIPLYEGPPANLFIGAKMFEHDSGAQDEIRNEVRKRFAQAFDEVKKTLTAIAGGIGGAAPDADALSRILGETMGKEASASGDMQQWIIRGLADIVVGAMGIQDDQYSPVSLTIYAQEMQHIPPVREYRCWNDPRPIWFTHSRTVDCTDDGGDLGRLTLLFRVRQK